MISISYRVLTGDDNRFAVIKQKYLHSRPSLFNDFFSPSPATFVDKTLAIEAFLRDDLSHHLVLRPRRCGKTYTLSMIRLISPPFPSAIADIIPSGSFSNDLS